jgi:hypothetical protein
VTDPYIGFWFLHERKLNDNVDAREAALRLIDSQSWETPVRYFSTVATAGHDLWKRPGMLKLGERRDVVDEALRHPSVRLLSLASESRNGPGARSIQFVREEHGSLFSFAYGERPAGGVVAAGREVDVWVDAVIAFFHESRGLTGVIAVMGSSNDIRSECRSASVIHDGALAHPFPEQHARMRVPNRRHLGTKYMRFPRWGTLVNPEHVAQLGGVEAIERAVEPALVRQLSGGIYVQLTSSVATALGEESMEKQRRFTELAEPLLPPPQRSLADR